MADLGFRFPERDSGHECLSGPSARPSMTGIPPTSRESLLARLSAATGGGEPFDVVVVGGGATGLGVALDAAARGFSTALFEADDFGKGTSSRATKLVHGGVRYLARGDVGLVREALRERRLMLANAPHLARPLPFVLPAYGWRGRLWDRWIHAAGLGLYDLMGGAGIGRTRLLGRRAVLATTPGLREDGLVGGVRYWDGQFDDARFAVALARTAIARGAVAVNHCRVVGLRTGAGGRLDGVEAEDRETGRRLVAQARCVVNATGVWVDAVRRLDEPAARDLVAPSQGAHLVIDRRFLPAEQAVLVPRTRDGRVLFVVPWQGKAILGTSDTPRSDLPLEPRPFAEEVDFILDEAARYLAAPPGRADVLSAWAGLRPLVRPARGADGDTKRISREHAIVVSRSGLVTVTGGKWTTYRAMAEDVLARCFAAGLLPARPAGVTRRLRLVGATAPEEATPLFAPPGLHLYGAEAADVAALPGADREILPGFTEAMVRFAVRQECARTVEDVLARRSRWLFLDARRAAAAAGAVAAVMAAELGPPFDAARSAAAFERLAAGYLLDRPAG